MITERKEYLIRIVEELPENEQHEVLDFVEFLKRKVSLHPSTVTKKPCLSQTGDVFVDSLLKSPLRGSGIDLKRVEDVGRTVDLAE